MSQQAHFSKTTCQTKVPGRTQNTLRTCDENILDDPDPRIEVPEILTSFRFFAFSDGPPAGEGNYAYLRWGARDKRERNRRMVEFGIEPLKNNL